MERLSLRCDLEGWLSEEAALPRALRRLRLVGYLPGIECAVAQLESLEVDMLLHENRVAPSPRA